MQWTFKISEWVADDQVVVIEIEPNQFKLFAPVDLSTDQQLAAIIKFLEEKELITEGNKLKHVRETHTKCKREYCPICDGGLFVCIVCGGAEGSLLPECPGRKLTAAEHDENYRKYCAGEPPFEPR